jgi:hypothetical protein
MSIAIRVHCVGHSFVGVARGKKLGRHANDSFTIGADYYRRAGLDTFRPFSHFAQDQDWLAE